MAEIAARRRSSVATPASKSGDALIPTRGDYRLPFLPPAAMSRRAAAGAGGGTELRAGLARVGRLEDFAFAARSWIVGRGFALRPAAGAIGQRFRAVHFVEMGLVDAGGGRTPGTPPRPR